jgi:hypothetical protein
MHLGLKTGHLFPIFKTELQLLFLVPIQFWVLERWHSQLTCSVLQLTYTYIVFLQYHRFEGISRWKPVLPFLYVELLLNSLFLWKYFNRGRYVFKRKHGSG